MKKMKLTALMLSFLSPALILNAQNSEQGISEKAAEFLATNAKYHVVIGVLVVIFLGLVVYGLILNRKMSNLEANQK